MTSLKSNSNRKQKLPPWITLVVVALLGLGAWYKFRPKVTKPAASLPIPSAAQPGSNAKPGSAQAHPSFATGPTYQASAPPAQNAAHNWRSGRYRVLESPPGILSIASEDNARLNSLMSEVQLNKCTFNAQQVCIVIQNQEVLLTKQLWTRLPDRLLLNSPWQRPLLTPRDSKIAR